MDILIFGANKAELQKTTAEVINCIKKAGLTMNKENCKFELPNIKLPKYHMLSAQGVKIDPEKVEAIGKLRAPEDKMELQRLLGMIMYLAKCILNLS